MVKTMKSIRAELIGTKEFETEGDPFEIRYSKFQRTASEDPSETIYGVILEKYPSGQNQATEQLIEPLTICPKHIDAMIQKMQDNAVSTSDFYSVVDQIYDATL